MITSDMSTAEVALAYLGFGLLLAMTIPATWFPLKYRKSPWSKSLTGRGLMLQSVVLAIVLDASALFGLLGIVGGVGAYVAQVLLFSLLNFTLWFQIKVLRQAQADDKAWLATINDDDFPSDMPPATNTTPPDDYDRNRRP